MDKKKKSAVTGETRRGDDDGEKDGVPESQLRARKKIIEEFGTFDFDPNYDYKAARKKKRF
jgi:hypothetical protein